jgi:perosamine synthetase
LSGRPFTRLAPGGSPITARSLRALMRNTHSEETLRDGLLERFCGSKLTLHRSGREALRVAFTQLAATTHRDEIAIPAYSCFSIPAAAVAAGLRVRLIDVDAKGQIARTSLEDVPLERIAAVVVTNLFGVPEPVEELAQRLFAEGVAVIDDAAQTLGAASREGPVGARTEIGILSFGRGKPLSALGGGALVWRQAPPKGVESEESELAGRWAALLRAAVYDAARIPLVLRTLSAIPALGIGTTVYDPQFARGPMPGSAIALAAAQLPELDEVNRSRARRAEALAARLIADTDFAPLLAAPGDTGIYPRLGVIAPSPARRDAALAALTSFGATAMYPTSLEKIAALHPHIVGETHCPGAQDFCARLLTLPTHAGLTRPRVDALIRHLRES